MSRMMLLLGIVITVVGMIHGMMIGDWDRASFWLLLLIFLAVADIAAAVGKVGRDRR